jgi:hypothetical protein
MSGLATSVSPPLALRLAVAITAHLLVLDKPTLEQSNNKRTNLDCARD